MIKNGQNIDDGDFVIQTTAGEALSARDAVYISTSDGKAYKCDADDLTKMDFAGFAQEAATLNGAVNIIHQGLATGFSGLTVGSRYYISGTAGSITTTSPANVTNVGVAISSTVIRIDKYPTNRALVFTANGTWTKRPGLKYIKVRAIGGGGAGGGVGANTDRAGAGGGSGEYVEEIIPADELGSTETVTVGAGGSGGNSNGPNGANTTFGAHTTAQGGNGGGGDANRTDGGAGVSAGSTGIINVPGGQGDDGVADGTITVCGRGADTPLGRGGGSQTFTSTSGGNGNAGTGYGAGGSGGGNRNSSTARTGGDGADGVVIVEEYY